jgi:hypothetical protein
MKPLSLLICSTVLAAGVLGGATAYRLAAEPSAGAATAATAGPSAAHVGTANRVRTRFAPCPAGSRPDGEVCVVHVVKTVTRPAAVGLAVPAPPAAPAPRQAGPTAAGGGEDDGDDDGDEYGDDHGDDYGEDYGDDGGDDYGDDHGDDHEDDHGDEDDNHEDDD